jgi:hypothetical protein
MMRLIKTFILRLYTDPELRDQVCGDLQALPGPKTFPFKSPQELLNRIHQLSNEEVEELSMRGSQDENNPDVS